MVTHAVLPLPCNVASPVAAPLVLETEEEEVEEEEEEVKDEEE